jgi:hypothetical protein
MLQVFYPNSSIHLLFSTRSSEHIFYLIKIPYDNIYSYLTLLALSGVVFSLYFNPCETWRAAISLPPPTRRKLQLEVDLDSDTSNNLI